MSNTKIVYKRIGYSNTVLLLNGENSILIDTGVKGNLQSFKILFKQYKLQPKDIQLIILTHVHHDHSGNLNALKELSNAKVLVHKNEFENLKNGFISIPKGIGFYPRLITGFARKFLPKFVSPKPLVADLINEDEFNLIEFGIEGKVISTPGHSAGSQSVLLGDSIIAGDTFVNLSNGRIFPPFAENSKTLLETWQKIFDLGIEEIYPAHGKKFKTEKAIMEYKKWKSKCYSQRLS